MRSAAVQRPPTSGILHPPPTAIPSFHFFAYPQEATPTTPNDCNTPGKSGVTCGTSCCKAGSSCYGPSLNNCCDPGRQVCGNKCCAAGVPNCVGTGVAMACCKKLCPKNPATCCD